jgi:hypothetical protein
MLLDATHEPSNRAQASASSRRCHFFKWTPEKGGGINVGKTIVRKCRGLRGAAICLSETRASKSDR